MGGGGGYELPCRRSSVEKGGGLVCVEVPTTADYNSSTSHLNCGHIKK